MAPPSHASLTDDKRQKISLWLETLDQEEPGAKQAILDWLGGITQMEAKEFGKEAAKTLAPWLNDRGDQEIETLHRTFKGEMINHVIKQVPAGEWPVMEAALATEYGAVVGMATLAASPEAREAADDALIPWLFQTLQKWRLKLLGQTLSMLLAQEVTGPAVKPGPQINKRNRLEETGGGSEEEDRKKKPWLERVADAKNRLIDAITKATDPERMNEALSAVDRFVADVKKAISHEDSDESSNEKQKNWLAKLLGKKTGMDAATLNAAELRARIEAEEIEELLIILDELRDILAHHQQAAQHETAKRKQEALDGKEDSPQLSSKGQLFGKVKAKSNDITTNLQRRIEVLDVLQDRMVVLRAMQQETQEKLQENIQQQGQAEQRGIAAEESNRPGDQSRDAERQEQQRQQRRRDRRRRDTRQQGQQPGTSRTTGRSEEAPAPQPEGKRVAFVAVSPEPEPAPAQGRNDKLHSLMASLSIEGLKGVVSGGDAKEVKAPPKTEEQQQSANRVKETLEEGPGKKHRDKVKPIELGG